MSLMLGGSVAHAGSVAVTELISGTLLIQTGKAINDAGDVLVSMGYLERDGYAVLRPSTGERHKVLLSPDTMKASFLTDAGQVIGYGGESPGLVYTFIADGGGITKLSAPGCSYSIPAAVNNAGAVLIDCRTSGTAFLYQKGTYTPIVYPGTTDNTPWALNSSGQVVGEYFTDNGIVGYYVWTAGTYRVLPLEVYSTPIAINDAGAVLAVNVVNARGGEEHYHSELVTPTSVQHIKVSDAISVEAVGLSADGQVALNVETDFGVLCPIAGGRMC